MVGNDVEVAVQHSVRRDPGALDQHRDPGVVIVDLVFFFGGGGCMFACFFEL